MKNGWLDTPLKHLSTEKCDGPFGSSLASEHYTDSGARVVRLQNIKAGGFDNNDAAFIDLNYYFGQLYRHTVLPGDVLIAGLGDDNNLVGRACVAPQGLGPALVKADCFRFRMNADKADARFVAYALSATAAQAAGELAGGSTRSRINLGLTAGRRVAAPAVTLQCEIANFLDKQTARIDALIVEKEQLLIRLNEYHLSTTWSLVTKGSRKDAPLVQTGIDWIGTAPSHWLVKKLKWLTPVKRGASPRPIDDPKFFDDEGKYAWVRIADVSASDGLLVSTEQQMSELGASLSVKREPGDLFLSIAGTVGRPCIAGIKCCIHDGFVWFPSIGHGPVRDWLFSIFEAGFAYAGLGKMGTQLNLNTDTVGNIAIPIPPLTEMEETLSALRAAKAANHALQRHVAEHLERLREYRSSLITAAVTGQLDISTFKLAA